MENYRWRLIQLVSDNHYKFECVHCGCEVGVGRRDDGSIDYIVCQTENCAYEDQCYDRYAALYVMLDEPLLGEYRSKFLQEIDEAQASEPMHPYLYRVSSGQPDTQ